MKLLVLIDGNAILHRAYHALPPLTAPDGSLVNAVYGFISVLFKITSEFKPTHFAVAFDRPAPTFRKELFVAYQAQRPVMEDELASQIVKIHEVLQAFNVPVYELDGFEADDVIATITEKVISDKRKVISKTKNLSHINSHVSPVDQVIVITGDRDLLQLVEDERVFVYMPTKGLSEAKLYGEKEAIERIGVKPSQVPDFKALAGDASDNYPGVAGIGPKTACELLVRFGTVENLYQAAHKEGKEIADKTREKLLAGEESAILGKTLATVRRDVPLKVDWKDLEVASLNTPESRRILAEYSFKSLLARLEKLYEEPKVKPPKKQKKEKKQANDEQLSLV